MTVRRPEDMTPPTLKHIDHAIQLLKGAGKGSADPRRAISSVLASLIRHRTEVGALRVLSNEWARAFADLEKENATLHAEIKARVAAAERHGKE